jgi:RNA polymerase sigma factor (sigma-70 family)
MGDVSVTSLIERLSSTAGGQAWAEFLAEYTPLMRGVIRRCEHEPADADECFGHVCAALSEDGFRRLRSFRPDGPASFRTWLMAVVANLCRDWCRRQRGRIRPVRAVARLPELDQHVYRLMFVDGSSRTECVAALAPRFPGLTDSSVAEISARLFGLLTPQQRWLLSARPHVPVRFRPHPGHGGDREMERLQAADPGPEEQVAEMQQRQQLRDAMARLPPEQRLLLRLRYEQGLTLAEVARLTRQPDPFRANRQIQAALEALASLMAHPEAGPGRKNA